MKLAISILIVIAFKGTSQVMWQVKKDTVVKWYLLANDEFSETQLNENKWQYGLPWSNFVVNQDLYFSKDNVIQNDGIIDFIAKKETKKFKTYDGEIDKKYLEKTGKNVIDNFYEVDYTAGLITSKRSFRYGYFEIRCKANSEKGIWPAFWLFGGTPNEEIDFFEGKGELANQIHLDVHCPNGCDNFKHGFLNLKKGWGEWIKANNNLSDDWNIISGEWQPNYIKFYLNGNTIGIIEREFKTYQQLYLNTSVAKDKQPFHPGPDRTTRWPNSFLVDYVRIWSMKDTINSYRNNYTPFENTSNTVKNSNLYDVDPIVKSNYMYNKKLLNIELGTVTLLKIKKNKFSLSFVGKKLGEIKIELYNIMNQKISNFTLNNVEYYILDLSNFNSGSYKLKIQLANQFLIQEVDIYNTEK